MSIMPDWKIKKLIKITPLDDGEHKSGKISSGLTSYGYDARVGRKFKLATNVFHGEIDPKNISPKSFVDIDLTKYEHDWHEVMFDHDSFDECDRCGAITSSKKDYQETCGEHRDYLLLPPYGFALAETVEYFEIPRNVLAICVGKSTYCRCGLIVNVSPLESSWKGKVTIELSNTTPSPVRVYADEGIMQIIFLEAEEECYRSYADKKGVYQNQAGLTLPRVYRDVFRS